MAKPVPPVALVTPTGAAVVLPSWGGLPEAAAQRLRVGDFQRAQPTPPKFFNHRDLRKKSQAQLAQHHTFAGLDGFHFQHDIRQQATAAEQAIHQGPVAGASVVGNDRHGLEFFEAHFPAGQSWVPGMPDENQRVVAQLNRFHFRMVQGTRDAQIHFPVENHFQYLRGISTSHADHHVRVALLIFLEHFGQQVSADGKRCGNGKRSPGDGMQFVNGLAGDGHLPKNLLGMRAQCLARQRERKFAVFALEQPSTKRILQSTDPGAYRRLADAQGFGGAVEATIGCNRQKSFELQYFHGRRASRTFILDVLIEIVYRCDSYNPFD